ncbi:hypothetical protein [Acinetobacter sp. MD2(2019)]|uniref:hypothetical protein n=1 Tax=Acinetobacter sp. MD2(2019) TaxID=2605273 RepID=UPI002D1EB191|nr:hypothetical protein [Acinetobacter sp. MD2(2019)]MEB3754443.1 hypothetical protein [Acinetobacter sp. MD2(2019)]
MPSYCFKFNQYLPHLIFSVLFFYAAKLAILGGTGVYFGLVLGFWLLYILAQSNVHQTWFYGITAVISFCSAWMLRENLSLMWVLLLPVLISALYWARHTHLTQYSAFLRCTFLLGLLALGYTEQQSLVQLKQHYASFETGETWQKLGAL